MNYYKILAKENYKLFFETMNNLTFHYFYKFINIKNIIFKKIYLLINILILYILVNFYEYINPQFKCKVPYISIFIPIYNKEQYLKRSIGSIQSQTLKNIEIIAINDCSTDNSLNVLKKLSKADKRIKIINNDRNHGLLYSRGMGILNSSGEYLMNLDPDDKISDFKNLELLFNEAKKNNSDLIIFRLKKIYQKKLNFTLYNNIKIHLLSSYGNNEVQKWKVHNLVTNKFVKRNIFLKAYEFFKSRILTKRWNYGEDNIWSRLIHKYSNSKIYINKYIYIYFKNELSLMHNRGNSLEKKNRIYRFEMIEEINKIKSILQLNKLFDYIKDYLKYDNEIRKRMIKIFLFMIKYYKSNKSVFNYIKLSLNKLSNYKFIIIKNHHNESKVKFHFVNSFINKIFQKLHKKIVMSIDIINIDINELKNYIYSNDVFIGFERIIVCPKLDELINSFRKNKFMIFLNSTYKYTNFYKYPNLFIYYLN